MHYKIKVEVDAYLWELVTTSAKEEVDEQLH